MNIGDPVEIKLELKERTNVYETWRPATIQSINDRYIVAVTGDGFRPAIPGGRFRYRIPQWSDQ